MARRIAVEIVGDSRSLEKAFAKSSKSAQQFDKNVTKTGKARGLFSGLGKAASLAAGGLGAAGLAGAARAAFTEMQDTQKVSAQTAAALKSTHGAANVSAKQIDTLATSLLNLSGVDDETIKSSENLLLTFTNIRNQTGKNNDIFNQATKTVLDMSTALGQDTKSSAIQLGKALNDPIKGITALSRVGVSFTDQQKDQIKAMVASGNTLGAQKLILGELTKEFGGSAKAAGQTLSGQLNKLKETALNLGGAIAETLTPQITQVVNSMVKWFTNSKNQQAIMNTVKDVAAALKTGLGALRRAFHLLSGVVGGNRNAIKLLIGVYAGFKILTLAGRISTLAGSLGVLRGKERAARTAAGGLRGSLVGKAGLYGAAVAVGYELGNLALKYIPGLRSAMTDLGGDAYNLAANLGLVNDQMKQFEGKKIPGQAQSGRIRQQAARLEAGGLSPQQAASRIARQHPGMAFRDIQVLAGVYGRPPVYNIGQLHVHGVQNAAQLEEALIKRAKKRPRTRH